MHRWTAERRARQAGIMKKVALRCKTDLKLALKREQAQSKGSKRRWSSIEEREKQSRRRVLFFREHPEAAKKHAEFMSSFMMQPHMRKASSKRTTEWLKRAWKDPIYRRSMSEMTSAMWEDKERRDRMTGNNRFEKGTFETRTGESFLYRSSWERVFAEILESSVVVDWFEHQPFSIKYNYAGRQHRYFPDFVLRLKDGRRFLVELKGEERPQDLAKYRVGRRYAEDNGMEFCVVREKPMEPLSRYVQ